MFEIVYISFFFFLNYLFGHIVFSTGLKTLLLINVPSKESVLLLEKCKITD